VARIRVAAHVHSEWSYDGRFSLADLARAFRRRRYDAVLMAEHDRGFDPDRWADYRAACAAASGDGIVLVPGIEYSDDANAVHVPVWGDVPFLGEGLQTGALLHAVQEAGALAILAHPGRRDVWRRFDPQWSHGLLGIEVWNRKYDGYAPSRAASELLRATPDLLPFFGLDLHTARQFHPLAMLIDVDGPVSEAAICDAMRARRCLPTAYRLPAPVLSRGAAVQTMRGAERARRSVARRIRARSGS
jgi:hypothetical protein